jgi:hypothetical protein
VSLRDWFFGQEGIYRQQLDALKAECADLKPPKVIYDTPERDESKPQCVHLYSDSDVLALQLQREQEQKDAPKNVPRFIRTVNS